MYKETPIAYGTSSGGVDTSSASRKFQVSSSSTGVLTTGPGVRGYMPQVNRENGGGDHQRMEFENQGSKKCYPKYKQNVMSSDQNVVRDDSEDPAGVDATTLDEGRFMSIFYAEGKVAAAYYDGSSRKICILSETHESAPNFNTSHIMVSDVQPSIVIMSRISDPKFVDVVNECSPHNQTTVSELLTDTSRLNTSVSVEMTKTTLNTTTETFRSATSVTPTFMAGGDTPAAKFMGKPSKLMTPSNGFKTTGADADDTRSTTGSLTENGMKTPQVKKVHDIKAAGANLVTIQHKHYVLGVARAAVLNSRLLLNPGIRPDEPESVKISSLNGKINFEESVSLRALSGLLSFLDETMIGYIDPQNGAASTGIKVEMHSLPDLVSLNKSSIDALSIMRTQIIPTAYQKTAVRQEDLTLKLLFEGKCPSTIGKNALRRMLMMPIRDKDVLFFRQNCIEFLMDDRNEILVAKLQSHMSQIKNMDRVFKRLRLSTPSTCDWDSLTKTLFNMTQVIDCITESGKFEFISVHIKKLKVNMDLIRDAVTRVSQVYDSTASREMSCFTVRPGVSGELDEARQFEARMPSFLAAAAVAERDYWESRGLSIPGLAVVYMRNNGYLLQVPLNTPNLFDVTPVLKREAHQVFHTPTDLFYATSTTKRLLEELGDPITYITDLQINIQIDLQKEIVDIEEDVFHLSKFCGELAGLISFAAVAKTCGWVKPEFTDDGSIEISGGRHPLQELMVLHFEPNDYWSGDSKRFERRVKIITGPNTSGKSVYIKQNALICYLAHIGSFVPADSAKIPRLDKIMTRIRSYESASIKVSHFLSDLNQVSLMIQEATPNSLLVIDEFGKGTRPEDGISLLSGLIHFFLGQKTPHILITTHFHSLFSLIDERNPKIQPLRLTVTNSNGEYINDYRIVEGRAESSLAGAVMAQVGMSQRLIQRAEEVSQLLSRREPLTVDYDDQQRLRMKNTLQILKDHRDLNCQSATDVQEFLMSIKDIQL